MSRKYSTAQIVAHYAQWLKEDALYPDQNPAANALQENYRRLNLFVNGRDGNTPGLKEAAVARDSFGSFLEKLREINEAEAVHDAGKAKDAFDEAVALFDQTEAQLKQANDKLPEGEVEYDYSDEDKALRTTEILRDIPGEEYRGRAVYKDYSQIKSAAQWIDDVMAPLKKGETADHRDIAMILAARQLAKCKLNDLPTLKSVQLSEEELRSRADAIMQTEAFQDYISRNSRTGYDPDEERVKVTIDPKVVTDGHGGKLEKDFAQYVRSREDVLDLPKDLYRRYQPKTADTTYEAYIEAHKKDFEKSGSQIRANDTNLGKNAAYMMAAFTLNEAGGKFSQSVLNRKAAEYYNSPEFRFFLRHDPKTLNLASSGDFEAFSSKMQAYKIELETKDEANYQARSSVISRVATNMQLGVFDGTLKEREMNRAYTQTKRAFDETFRFMGNKKSERPAGFKKMSDYSKGVFTDGLSGKHKEAKDFTMDDMMKIWNAAQSHYKELAASKDPQAAALREKMEKVLKTGANYFAPPKFTDKRRKTAAQQEKEYEEKNRKAFLNGIDKYIEDYAKAEVDSYNRAWKPVEKELAAAGVKPLSNKLDVGKVPTKQTDVKRTEYMKKRGPKFRAMAEAADAYKKGNEPDSRLTMDLVDKILDYQNGKEKVMKGDAGKRFDDSMTLLTAATVGTPLEKTILQPQIDKINRIRGAKEGDPNFIRKEDYFDAGILQGPQAGEEQKQKENVKNGPQGIAIQ